MITLKMDDFSSDEQDELRDLVAGLCHAVTDEKDQRHAFGSIRWFVARAHDRYSTSSGKCGKELQEIVRAIRTEDGADIAELLRDLFVEHRATL